VRVGTEHWSAKSENERPIDVGATVEVARIDGVALVVRPVGEMPTPAQTPYPRTRVYSSAMLTTPTPAASAKPSARFGGMRKRINA
jgi:hypothetical protein